MLDKIMYLNSNHIVLIFTNRKPFHIRSTEGNALALYKWLITPTTAPLSLHEFVVAMDAEETQCTSLKIA